METIVGKHTLGSGKKMSTDLNNYNRSTFNLDSKITTSLAPGVLVPFYTKLMNRGDKFDLTINADLRTIPTQGPLFSTFKFQVDFFMCPIRLYQAILHNNPTKIGLRMKDVLFPQINISGQSQGLNNPNLQMNPSSLIKYLGLSGIGLPTIRQYNPDNPDKEHICARNINAVPILAYYDIYKNYYANTQEEKGKIISGSITKEKDSRIIKIYGKHLDENRFQIEYNPSKDIILRGDNSDLEWGIIGYDLNRNIKISIYTKNGENIDTTLQQAANDGYIKLYINNSRHYVITFNPHKFYEKGEPVSFNVKDSKGQSINKLQIIDFPLSNIDDMRMDILSHNKFGIPFHVESKGNDFFPYSAVYNTNYNSFPMNGLCLKTYQNDLFNNWINTQWISGNNGISEITKINVENNSINVDSINLAQKLYNMLNRVALAGNTYEDWQNVVWEQREKNYIEYPIYLGGMSKEIVFDEIIQSAGDDKNPLGTIGGRGRLNNNSGNHIIVKAEEPSFLMGIVSITPRISYNQGNEFYLTDIKSVDDLHKPALDGIGWQSLIGERLAWFDTKVQEDTNKVIKRTEIGKVPAWIEYQTDYDRTYGDFAQEEGQSFMILNRNYRMNREGKIVDATTYIDPTKHNYAFAYTALDAQNFWTQINIENKARRIMSAKMIPNV